MDARVRNPLAAGFYTIAEAARLIRVGRERRIHGWLRGYPGRNVGPLLERDFAPIDKDEELSFLDLMEVRFVEHFREHGVKARSLRLAADRLRAELDTSHPFASKRVLLVADQADVYVKEVLKESAKAAEDFRLRSLVSGNYVIYEAIRNALLPGVTFEADGDLTDTWAPIPDRFPNIIINPKIAYGQPSIPRGIPTATLRDAVRAENDNIDAVAYWYGVNTTDILEAINFEQALDETARQKAA